MIQYIKQHMDNIQVTHNRLIMVIYGVVCKAIYMFFIFLLNYAWKHFSCFIDFMFHYFFTMLISK
jgi:hypothetical protein